ncbi:MAG: hypothetical protein ABL909_09290 [Sphingopyxis sp.]
MKKILICFALAATCAATSTAILAQPPIASTKGGVVIDPGYWFEHIEGHRVAPWGAGEDYRWLLDDWGRGTISVPSGDAEHPGAMRNAPFTLSAAQLDRFARLMEQFRDATYDEGLCASDQAQEIVTWNYGGQSGMATFDHGCTDARARAKWALLNQALNILRQAAGALPT